jgi:putative tricarboxylic transport membrane protein
VSKSAWSMVPALFMTALALVVLVNTSDLIYWADFSPGPAFAPRWVAIAGIVLSAVLVFQTLRGIGPEVQLDLPSRVGLYRAVLTLLALIAFAALAPTLGLLIAAGLTGIFLTLVVLRRPLIPSLVSTALTLLVIWGIFSLWLGIPLPHGIFGI